MQLKGMKMIYTSVVLFHSYMDVYNDKDIPRGERKLTVLVQGIFILNTRGCATITAHLQQCKNYI